MISRDMSKCAFETPFQRSKKKLYWDYSKKEGKKMSDAERLIVLEEENRRLKEDNDKLLEILAQMRVTLNRLVFRYISDES